MENQPEPQRARVTAAEADALLEEQKASGLSIAAFAKAKDVPAWSIYNARARARRKAMTQFAEVSVVPSLSSPSPRQPELELVLPSGLTLRVPSDFDEVVLRRLLGVLAAC